MNCLPKRKLSPLQICKVFYSMCLLVVGVQPNRKVGQHFILFFVPNTAHYLPISIFVFLSRILVRIIVSPAKQTYLPRLPYCWRGPHVLVLANERQVEFSWQYSQESFVRGETHRANLSFSPMSFVICSFFVFCLKCECNTWSYSSLLESMNAKAEY